MLFVSIFSYITNTFGARQSSKFNQRYQDDMIGPHDDEALVLHWFSSYQ